MPLFPETKRRMGRGVLFWVLCIAIPAFASPDAFIEKARQQKLAEDPGWKRLLHYRKGFLGGEKSDIDGKDFFLSKRGRKDAQAEMDATIRAFFEPPSISTDGQHPLSLYMALY